MWEFDNGSVLSPSCGYNSLLKQAETYGASTALKTPGVIYKLKWFCFSEKLPEDHGDDLDIFVLEDKINKNLQ